MNFGGSVHFALREAEDVRHLFYQACLLLKYLNTIFNMAHEAPNDP